MRWENNFTTENRWWKRKIYLKIVSIFQSVKAFEYLGELVTSIINLDEINFIFFLHDDIRYITLFW